MSVTPDQRRASRPFWRTLVLTANAAAQAPAADLGELRAMGVKAMSWVAPTDALHDVALCGAFASTAYAYARQPSGRAREPLVPCLLIYAELVGDMLDRCDAAEASPQRPPPYYADKD